MSPVLYCEQFRTWHPRVSCIFPYSKAMEKYRLWVKGVQGPHRKSEAQVSSMHQNWCWCFHTVHSWSPETLSAYRRNAVCHDLLSRRKPPQLLLYLKLLKLVGSPQKDRLWALEKWEERGRVHLEKHVAERMQKVFEREGRAPHSLTRSGQVSFLILSGLSLGPVVSKFPEGQLFFSVIHLCCPGY